MLTCALKMDNAYNKKKLVSMSHESEVKLSIKHIVSCFCALSIQVSLFVTSESFLGINAVEAVNLMKLKIEIHTSYIN